MQDQRVVVAGADVFKPGKYSEHAATHPGAKKEKTVVEKTFVDVLVFETSRSCM